MIEFSKWAYNWLNIQLPTTKPLWTPQEGLQSIINDDGYVDQHDKSPQLFVAATEQQKREHLFETMIIHKNIVDLKGRVLVPNVPAVIDSKIKKMVSNRKRYENIAHQFPNPIRWYHIFLLHLMECDLNFNCYLGNGQPWYKKTTIVPKGRGAFSSFEEGAIDAIKYDRLDKVQDWSIGNTLYILEGFNGYGYVLYRGINSPYIWSGSNHYTSGKYITDNVYSKIAVSSQIGIALYLKRILEIV